MTFDIHDFTQYLGKPYVSDGKSPEGFYCWGFPIYVYAQKGIELIDLKESEIEGIKKGEVLLVEDYYKNWTRVDKPRLGDILLFQNVGGRIDHAGIYLKDGIFIHATRAGVVVGRLHQWKTRIHGFYRHKDVK